MHLRHWNLRIVSDAPDSCDGTDLKNVFGLCGDDIAVAVPALAGTVGGAEAAGALSSASLQLQELGRLPGAVGAGSTVFHADYSPAWNLLWTDTPESKRETESIYELR